MIFNLSKKATILILLAGTFSSQAQTFVPSTAHEFTYNGPHARRSQDVSCFAFNNRQGHTAWGEVDVYLAARGSGFSEVTVQFTAPHDPTNVLYQENFHYDDGSYFQVGAVYNENTGNVQILVAYQWAGFKVDIYDITTSSTNPIVYNTTMTLVPWTWNSNYFDHRIRMDSHTTDLRRVAIVWDNPYIGLQTIACENGNWGNILNIDNTAGESGPDIAFTQETYSGEPKVHLVHHDPTGTAITTSSIVFSNLMTAAGTISESVNDVNHIGIPLQSNLVLDCPDLFDGRMVWAYTYTDQNNQEVFVRHMNQNFSATANTISVNTGVLGNADISGQYNVFSPSLHYGNNYAGIGENIVVGWYSTDGVYNGYIGLKMSTDPFAPTLVSDPDYLELPNAMTPGAPYPMPIYEQPGIAFSKGDVELAPRHLYAVYYDINNATGDHQFHHTFHDWGSTVFRINASLGFNVDKTYPNPFINAINTTVTLQKKGTARLELTDVSGRIVAQYETKAEEGSYPIQLGELQHIVPGTYFLKTSIDGKKVDTRTVVKK